MKKCACSITLASGNDSLKCEFRHHFNCFKSRNERTDFIRLYILGLLQDLQACSLLNRDQNRGLVYRSEHLEI